VEVSCSIRNHDSSTEGRYEAGDRRAMAHDCTRSCSGRTSSRCRRGSPSASLAVEVAGVLAAAAPLGMPSGKERTSPWLEAIAGIRERPYPRLGSKPVPAPRTRPEVRCGFRHGFSPAVPATQASTPSLPSAKKGWGKPLPSQKVCAGQSSVRGNPVCGAIQCAGKMCGAVL
jgi:hypothetical protein